LKKVSVGQLRGQQHRCREFEPSLLSPGISPRNAVLAEIPSVVKAVACAVEIQTAISAQKAALTTRTGVNVGPRHARLARHA